MLLSSRFTFGRKDACTRESLVGIIRSSSNRRVSPKEIEKQIKNLPLVLTTADPSYGWTPLHWACHTRAPIAVVQILLDLGPEAASMTNISGNAPLHVLCQDDRTCPKVMRMLINSYPEALTKKDSDGHTPLHFACRFLFDDPECLALLLEKCPPEVLSMQADNGYTPFQYAVEYGVSSDILKLMMDSNKKALQQTNSCGATALHLACRSSRSSLEALKLLVGESPIQCLILDQSSSRNAPYDLAVQWERPNEVQEYMLKATQDATLSLLKCIFTSPFTPASVHSHLEESVLVNAGISRDSFVVESSGLSNSVHPQLNHETIKFLLHNNVLQGLLQEETFQDLVYQAGSTKAA
jgi:ankyrin repeat protein